MKVLKIFESNQPLPDPVRLPSTAELKTFVAHTLTLAPNFGNSQLTAVACKFPSAADEITRQCILQNRPDAARSIFERRFLNLSYEINRLHNSSVQQNRLKLRCAELGTASLLFELTGQLFALQDSETFCRLKNVHKEILPKKVNFNFELRYAECCMYVSQIASAPAALLVNIVTGLVALEANPLFRENERVLRIDILSSLTGAVRTDDESLCLAAFKQLRGMCRENELGRQRFDNNQRPMYRKLLGWVSSPRPHLS